MRLVRAPATGKADGTSSNDVVITPTSDKMCILLFDAGGAGGTVLIKAGASSPHYNIGDITVTLGASEYQAIFVESARVKALSGTDKSKIRLEPSANTTVWAFSLPA